MKIFKQRKFVTYAIIFLLVASFSLMSLSIFAQTINFTNPTHATEVDVEDETLITGGYSLDFKTFSSDTDSDYTSNNLFSISSVQGLVNFANSVNTGECDFYGKTVYLSSNIDATGTAIYPIGIGTAFCGTFNGNNKTLSNLTICGETLSELPNSVVAVGCGLFGKTIGATIVNLKIVDTSLLLMANYFENATANVNYWLGTLAGYAEDSSFENCMVSGTNITTGRASGQQIYSGIQINNSASVDIYLSIGGIYGYNSSQRRPGLIPVTDCYVEAISCVISTNEFENIDKIEQANYYGISEFAHATNCIVNITNNNISFASEHFYGRITEEEDSKSLTNGYGANWNIACDTDLHTSITCLCVSSPKQTTTHTYIGQATYNYCVSLYDYKQTIDFDISCKGGKSGTTWYYYPCSSFNGGCPVLRQFVEWQSIEIRSNNSTYGLVNLNSNGYAYSTELLYGKDYAIPLSFTNATDSTTNDKLIFAESENADYADNVVATALDEAKAKGIILSKWTDANGNEITSSATTVSVGTTIIAVFDYPKCSVTFNLGDAYEFQDETQTNFVDGKLVISNVPIGTKITCVKSHTTDNYNRYISVYTYTLLSQDGEIIATVKYTLKCEWDFNKTGISENPSSSTSNNNLASITLKEEHLDENRDYSITPSATLKNYGYDHSIIFA